jgi:hypothetical protein
LAGCVPPGSPAPASEAAPSFTETEKVHGVTLVRRYLDEQGIPPDKASYQVDEQVKPGNDNGGRAKSRQMFVTVSFQDREPWRLLVEPDGSLMRVESDAQPAAEGQGTSIVAP